VYPAHGAGSLCGKNLSTDTVSTIGTQRRFNYALQPMSRQRFIEIVTAELPDAPAYFTYDAVLNTRERPTLERTLAGSSTRFRRSKRLLSSGLARNCWTRASRRSSKGPPTGQRERGPRRQLRELVRHDPRRRQADRADRRARA
jgi:hypothetical protein